jgi:hypothetical protein
MWNHQQAFDTANFIFSIATDWFGAIRRISRKILMKEVWTQLGITRFI